LPASASPPPSPPYGALPFFLADKRSESQKNYDPWSFFSFHHKYRKSSFLPLLSSTGSPFTHYAERICGRGAFFFSSTTLSLPSPINRSDSRQLLDHLPSFSPPPLQRVDAVGKQSSFAPLRLFFFCIHFLVFSPFQHRVLPLTSLRFVLLSPARGYTRS